VRKPQTKRGPGQPRKERAIRYPIRIHDAERARWRVAAARAGMTLLDWIPAVLNGEEARPTHVHLIGSRATGLADADPDPGHEIDASPRVDRSR